MFSLIDIVAILLIGACAGIVTGIMGASGVVVVVPALTLALNFPIHIAIGTSLLIDVIAASVTSYAYYRHGNIYIKPGLWIALGSVTGAQAGSVLASMIPLPFALGSGHFFPYNGYNRYIRNCGLCPSGQHRYLCCSYR